MRKGSWALHQIADEMLGTRIVRSTGTLSPMGAGPVRDAGGVCASPGQGSILLGHDMSLLW